MSAITLDTNILETDFEKAFPTKDSLVELSQKVQNQKEVIFTDEQGNEFNFGSHFHGYGKGVVKGMNLCVKRKNGQFELTFNLNKPFRAQLQKTIHPSFYLLQNLFGAVFGKKKNLNFKTTSNWNGNDDAYVATFKNGSRFYVGKHKAKPTQWDRVCVTGKTLNDINQALDEVNLGKVLKKSSSDDIQRLKIAQLFRTFYPKNSTSFEIQKRFYHLPSENLKKEITKIQPKMKKIFDNYLPNMVPTPILPGRMRYTMPGLAENLRKKGAYGLRATLTGVNSHQQETFHRIAMIIKMGMLSTEFRFFNGIQKTGMSSYTDFEFGSSDSVFTRLITKSSDDSNWGVSLLLPLEALETGTYQYHTDKYGSRHKNGASKNFYKVRPGIEEFVEKEAFSSSDSNEVMIKERAKPFKILLSSEQTKQGLVSYLKKHNIITLDQQGHEKINGIDVDQFLLVGTKVKQEHFNKESYA